MRIALVGAGNVASCMAGALKSAGHTIECVYSRTEESARTLADALGVPYVTRIEDIPSAQCLILMLRDDALLQLAGRIVATHPDALLLHTSGSVPMSVLSDAGARHCGVLYPMQTFSKGKTIEWSSVPIFIEASGSNELERVRELASSLSESVQVLDSDQRCKLHLAAVFACNFSNRMYAISERLLQECGISFNVMSPLIAETAAKSAVMSPEKAQTGPAVRGDRRVMEMHKALLAEYPEWQRLYELISEDINNSYK